MLTAIVYGLTPDEKWDARHNPGCKGRRHAGARCWAWSLRCWWAASVLMGTIAFGGQRFFEWQLEGRRARRQRVP
jgi:hypothetical protein